MEIVISLISELNRHLNLGVYVTFDGKSIHLNSLNEGRILLAMNARQSLEFYQAIVELLRLIKSWNNYVLTERPITAAKVAQTIFVKYNFDITNHYQLQKYGNY